jgi:hypothetical protein
LAFSLSFWLSPLSRAYFLWVTDETLRKTFEMNQRPWVSVDVAIVGPLIFEDTGSSVPLKIEIKNHGLSLAEDVRLFPVLYPNEIGQISTQEIQDARCRKPRNNADHGLLAYTLFPGQSSVTVAAPGLTEADIKSLKAVEKAEIFPSVVVCVSYRASLTKAIHFTSAFFGIVQRIAENSNLTTAIELKSAPMGPERLYLMPLGSFAD